MTLDNLVGNALERIEPDPAAIGRLVRAGEDAVARSLAGMMCRLICAWKRPSPRHGRGVWLEPIWTSTPSRKCLSKKNCVS